MSMCRIYIVIFVTFLCSFLVDCLKIDYRRVCYYTNWSQYRDGKGKFVPEDIDPSLCTHIIFAFAKIEGNYLAAREWNDESVSWRKGLYERVNNLKEVNNDLKTLLSVGGWTAGSKPFLKMASTAAGREEFANTTVMFLRENNFDGLDIDWEYPGRDNIATAATERRYLSLLLKELRRTFNKDAKLTGAPKLLLSIAVPTGKEIIDSGFNVPEINRLVDMINLMSYNFHGSWERTVGHHSALFEKKKIDRKFSVAGATNYWVDLGANPKKINLGLPLYGRGFTLKYPFRHKIGSPVRGGSKKQPYTNEEGYMSYYEICSMIQQGAIMTWDRQRRVPYLRLGDQWVGYDNKRSLKEKVRWLKKYTLGGVMVWALPLDDFNGSTCRIRKPYPLMKMIKNELSKPQDGKNIIINRRRAVKEKANKNRKPQNKAIKPQQKVVSKNKPATNKTKTKQMTTKKMMPMKKQSKVKNQQFPEIKGQHSKTKKKPVIIKQPSVTTTIPSTGTKRPTNATTQLKTNVSTSARIKQPIVTSKRPSTTAKQPAATTKTPTPTTKTSTRKAKQPAATTKKPSTTTNQPTTTTNQPTTTTKQSTTKSSKESTTSKQPSAVTKKSLTTKGIKSRMTTVRETANPKHEKTIDESLTEPLQTDSDITSNNSDSDTLTSEFNLQLNGENMLKLNDETDSVSNAQAVNAKDNTFDGNTATDNSSTSIIKDLENQTNISSDDEFITTSFKGRKLLQLASTEGGGGMGGMLNNLFGMLSGFTRGLRPNSDTGAQSSQDTAAGSGNGNGDTQGGLRNNGQDSTFVDVTSPTDAMGQPDTGNGRGTSQNGWSVERSRETARNQLNEREGLGTSRATETGGQWNVERSREIARNQLNEREGLSRSRAVESGGQWNVERSREQARNQLRQSLTTDELRSLGLGSGQMSNRESLRNQEFGSRDSTNNNNNQFQGANIGDNINGQGNFQSMGANDQSGQSGAVPRNSFGENGRNVASRGNIRTNGVQQSGPRNGQRPIVRDNSMSQLRDPDLIRQREPSLRDVDLSMRRSQNNNMGLNDRTGPNNRNMINRSRQQPRAPNNGQVNGARRRTNSNFRNQRVRPGSVNRPTGNQGSSRGSSTINNSRRNQAAPGNNVPQGRIQRPDEQNRRPSPSNRGRQNTNSQNQQRRPVRRRPNAASAVDSRRIQTNRQNIGRQRNTGQPVGNARRGIPGRGNGVRNGNGNGPRGNRVGNINNNGPRGNGIGNGESNGPRGNGIGNTNNNGPRGNGIGNSNNNGPRGNGIGSGNNNGPRGNGIGSGNNNGPRGNGIGSGNNNGPRGNGIGSGNNNGPRGNGIGSGNNNGPRDNGIGSGNNNGPRANGIGSGNNNGPRGNGIGSGNNNGPRGNGIGNGINNGPRDNGIGNGINNGPIANGIGNGNNNGPRVNGIGNGSNNGQRTNVNINGGPGLNSNMRMSRNNLNRQNGVQGRGRDNRRQSSNGRPNSVPVNNPDNQRSNGNNQVRPFNQQPMNNPNGNGRNVNQFNNNGNNIRTQADNRRGNSNRFPSNNVIDNPGRGLSNNQNEPTNGNRFNPQQGLSGNGRINGNMQNGMPNRQFRPTNTRNNVQLNGNSNTIRNSAGNARQPTNNQQQRMNSRLGTNAQRGGNSQPQIVNQQIPSINGFDSVTAINPPQQSGTDMRANLRESFSSQNNGNNGIVDLNNRNTMVTQSPQEPPKQDTRAKLRELLAGGGSSVVDSIFSKKPTSSASSKDSSVAQSSKSVNPPKNAEAQVPNNRAKLRELFESKSNGVNVGNVKVTPVKPVSSSGTTNLDSSRAKLQELLLAQLNGGITTNTALAIPSSNNMDMLLAMENGGNPTPPLSIGPVSSGSAASKVDSSRAKYLQLLINEENGGTNGVSLANTGLIPTAFGTGSNGVDSSRAKLLQLLIDEQNVGNNDVSAPNASPLVMTTGNNGVGSSRAKFLQSLIAEENGGNNGVPAPNALPLLMATGSNGVDSSRAKFLQSLIAEENGGNNGVPAPNASPLLMATGSNGVDSSRAKFLQNLIAEENGGNNGVPAPNASPLLMATGSNGVDSSRAKFLQNLIAEENGGNNGVPAPNASPLLMATGSNGVDSSRAKFLQNLIAEENGGNNGVPAPNASPLLMATGSNGVDNSRAKFLQSLIAEENGGNNGVPAPNASPLLMATGSNGVDSSRAKFLQNLIAEENGGNNGVPAPNASPFLMATASNGVDNSRAKLLQLLIAEENGGNEASLLPPRPAGTGLGNAEISLSRVKAETSNGVATPSVANGNQLNTNTNLPVNNTNDKLAKLSPSGTLDSSRAKLLELLLAQDAGGNPTSNNTSSVAVKSEISVIKGTSNGVQPFQGQSNAKIISANDNIVLSRKQLRELLLMRESGVLPTITGNMAVKTKSSKQPSAGLDSSRLKLRELLIAQDSGTTGNDLVISVDKSPNAQLGDQPVVLQSEVTKTVKSAQNTVSLPKGVDSSRAKLLKLLLQQEAGSVSDAPTKIKTQTVVNTTVVAKKETPKGLTSKKEQSITLIEGSSNAKPAAEKPSITLSESIERSRKQLRDLLVAQESGTPMDMTGVDKSITTNNQPQSATLSANTSPKVLDNSRSKLLQLLMAQEATGAGTGLQSDTPLPNPSVAVPTNFNNDIKPATGLPASTANTIAATNTANIPIQPLSSINQAQNNPDSLISMLREIFLRQGSSLNGNNFSPPNNIQIALPPQAAVTTNAIPALNNVSPFTNNVLPPQELNELFQAQQRGTSGNVFGNINTMPSGIMPLSPIPSMSNIGNQGGLVNGGSATLRQRLMASLFRPEEQGAPENNMAENFLPMSMRDNLQQPAIMTLNGMIANTNQMMSRMPVPGISPIDMGLSQSPFENANIMGRMAMLRDRGNIETRSGTGVGFEQPQQFTPPSQNRISNIRTLPNNGNLSVLIIPLNNLDSSLQSVAMLGPSIQVFNESNLSNLNLNPVELINLRNQLNNIVPQNNNMPTTNLARSNSAPSPQFIKRNIVNLNPRSAPVSSASNSQTSRELRIEIKPQNSVSSNTARRVDNTFIQYNEITTPKPFRAEAIQSISEITKPGDPPFPLRPSPPPIQRTGNNNPITKKPEIPKSEVLWKWQT